MSAQEVGLGLHSLPDRLEAGSTELVEDQLGVLRAVLDQEDSERLRHRRLPFMWGLIRCIHADDGSVGIDDREEDRSHGHTLAVTAVA